MFNFLQMGCKYLIFNEIAMLINVFFVPLYYQKEEN